MAWARTSVTKCTAVHDGEYEHLAAENEGLFEGGLLEPDRVACTKHADVLHSTALCLALPRLGRK